MSLVMKKQSLKKLIDENKRLLLADINLVEKIYEKIDNKHVKIYR